MKISHCSFLTATILLATPATAGILNCLSTLLPYGLGDFTLYTPLLDRIPEAVTGLKIILAFPPCCHDCLVTVPCNCGMVDYACRCKDPLHIFAQSDCIVKKCQSDRERALAYNAWANTCAPHLGVSVAK